MATICTLNCSHLFVPGVTFRCNIINVSLSIDIDDCTPSLCQHGGKCIDKVNDFECDCCPGWSGRNCDQCKLDFISNPEQAFSQMCVQDSVDRHFIIKVNCLIFHMLPYKLFI